MALPARPPELTLANWDLGGAPSAWAYLHAGELLGSTEIPTQGSAAALASAEEPAVAQFLVEPGVTLDRYVAQAAVSGIVVVRRGTVVFERYPRMRPDDRHLLMSVSKVFASVLVGMLEERGALDLSSAVDTVLPEVAGSGWTGVPVRDVLDMASGIDCPEEAPAAYSDPSHPFYRFEASLGWRPDGGSLPTTYSYVASLPSHRRPGEAYEYTSVNTFVLSWLVERLTGMPYAEVLGREIWSRAGFEAPAQLCCSATGAAVSHGGLSTRIRDLARFGMLLTPSAHLVTSSEIIGAGHLRRIQSGGRPRLHKGLAATQLEEVSAAFGGERPPASRQWDFAVDDGDLFKGGFGGQGLYVSPVRDVVVAFSGTPLPDGSSNRLRWVSRRLALALA